MGISDLARCHFELPNYSDLVNKLLFGGVIYRVKWIEIMPLVEASRSGEKSAMCNLSVRVMAPGEQKKSQNHTMALYNP